MAGVLCGPDYEPEARHGAGDQEPPHPATPLVTALRGENLVADDTKTSKIIHYLLCDLPAA